MLPHSKKKYPGTILCYGLLILHLKLLINYKITQCFNTFFPISIYYGKYIPYLSLYTKSLCHFKNRKNSKNRGRMSYDKTVNLSKAQNHQCGQGGHILPTVLMLVDAE